MTTTSGVLLSAIASGLGVEVTHGPSGARLSTQPPKDNGGTGQCFSPTDLLAASLAACALTTLALAAQREGLAWGKASARVEKIMASAPRRVSTLPLSLILPADFPHEHRARFEEIAHCCPVALSLNPSVEFQLSCSWTAL